MIKKKKKKPDLHKKEKEIKKKRQDKEPEERERREEQDRRRKERTRAAGRGRRKMTNGTDLAGIHGDPLLCADPIRARLGGRIVLSSLQSLRAAVTVYIDIP